MTGAEVRSILFPVDEARDGATKITLDSVSMARRLIEGHKTQGGGLTHPICMASPTPLLTDPPMLLPFHEVPCGTYAKIPDSTRKQAKYFALLFSTVIRITNPTMLIHNQLTPGMGEKHSASPR